MRYITLAECFQKRCIKNTSSNGSIIIVKHHYRVNNKQCLRCAHLQNKVGHKLKA